MSTWADAVRALKLLQGRGKLTSLLKACHAGRLKGGLSVSLRASADEVVGPVTHALGGTAKAFRLLDVRTGTPPVLVVQVGERTEKWDVPDVEALVHNLNDLYRDDPLAGAVAVLGDWQDMLQLWVVPKAALPKLLQARVLDDARNTRSLWALTQARERG